MNADKLQNLIDTATKISDDYGRDPAGDRRQVRRLAELVAKLGEHAKSQLPNAPAAAAWPAVAERVIKILDNLISTAAQHGEATYGLLKASAPIPNGPIVWAINGRKVSKREARAFLIESES